MRQTKQLNEYFHLYQNKIANNDDNRTLPKRNNYKYCSVYWILVSAVSSVLPLSICCCFSNQTYW